MLLFWIIIPEAYYNNSVILQKKISLPGAIRTPDLKISVLKLQSCALNQLGYRESLESYVGSELVPMVNVVSLAGDRITC